MIKKSEIELKRVTELMGALSKDVQVHQQAVVASDKKMVDLMQKRKVVINHTQQ